MLLHLQLVSDSLEAPRAVGVELLVLGIQAVSPRALLVTGFSAASLLSELVSGAMKLLVGLKLQTNRLNTHLA